MEGSRHRRRAGYPRSSESPAPSDPERGQAAEAIGDAEAALAHQNSASSQLDLHVVSAILNAHLQTVKSADALSKLQQETEAAVRTRSDLDTPAGARDFQRFLISKLRDIRAVVANVSLDDTSKAALMAAWTALYDASKNPSTFSGDHPRAPAAAELTGDTGTHPADVLDAGWPPYPDSLLFGDPGLLTGDAPVPGPALPAMPTAPPIPGIPGIGGGEMPSTGGLPGEMAGWGVPGGLGIPALLDALGGDRALRGLDETQLLSDDRNQNDSTFSGGEDKQSEDKQSEDDGDAGSDQLDSSPAGPTSVVLPTGETVIAATPELAAVIEAAAGGTPIAEAFHQQGITLPPPGTEVAHPIDPARVVPGDIGIFTDRHALGLGNSKALLDGQIQHISTVGGPRFLGWQHPSMPATATTPVTTEPPTPTRPA